MTKRTKFLVEYNGYAARFSDHYEAQRFAWEKSKSGGADVYASDGIIGQWRFGEPSEEFRHLRAMTFMGLN